jgi:hypothetical protein
MLEHYSTRPGRGPARRSPPNGIKGEVVELYRRAKAGDKAAAREVDRMLVDGRGCVLFSSMAEARRLIRSSTQPVPQSCASSSRKPAREVSADSGAFIGLSIGLSH